MRRDLRICPAPELRIILGKEPSDWKAMPSVGAGVNEIRVHTKGEHRVMYVAKFNEAVYVLHALHSAPRSTTSNRRRRGISTWSRSAKESDHERASED